MSQMLSALHITKHTAAKHTATVIVLHGSGGTGANMQEWTRLMAKNFSFPQINVLYPTAPMQPYTPAGGEPWNVWFDRSEITIEVPEIIESVDEMEAVMKNLIQKENAAGIPSNRIIVGGFSMGGALALHTAYRWHHNLAGVFAISAFLNRNSVVYSALKNSNPEQLPPLLQIHGNNDDLVPHQWGQSTHRELLALGVKGEFHIMDRLGHSLNKQGVELVKNWIEKLLPEV